MTLRNQYSDINAELKLLGIELRAWVEGNPKIKENKKYRDIPFKKGILLRIEVSPSPKYIIVPEELINKVGLAQAAPCLVVKRKKVEVLLVEPGKLSKEDFSGMSKPVLGKPKVAVGLCLEKEK